MKQKSALGLDVGNRHINMVRLEKDSQGLRLLDFASVEINSRQGKTEQLKQLEKIVQQKGLASAPVNIGVSGESIIVRYIDLPKMNKTEIAQALKYEAQQYIPFKIEEVIFDYHLLESEPAKQQSNRMKIILVAAKKELILEFVGLIKKVELQPRIIDLNSFSLINCFQANGPKLKKEDVFALINLEFDLVNIDILQGPTPFFTRDISLIEDVLSLRPEEDKEKTLFETMRPLLANLIREIRVSIDYFESEFEKQVPLIYLTGEVAKVPALINFFGAQLGREVVVWNPVQNLLVDSAMVKPEDLQEAAPLLALACGLALRDLK